MFERRRPVIHLILILLGLAALATAAWWYSNSWESAGTSAAPAASVAAPAKGL